jgi:hypothetical protein
MEARWILAHHYSARSWTNSSYFNVPSHIAWHNLKFIDMKKIKVERIVHPLEWVRKTF